MKQVLSIILILAIFNQAEAQRRRSNVIWFDVSLKGGPGTSYFKNFNTSEDPNITMISFNPSYFYGGSLGATFGKDWGVSFEAISNYYSQGYSVRPDRGSIYRKDVEINSLDLGLVFNYASRAGFYFEFGPKFCKMQSSGYSCRPPYDLEIDTLNRYNASIYKGIMLGGGLILLTSDDERFRINLGARLTYIFDDIMNDSKIPPSSDNRYKLIYTDSHATSPLMAHVLLEVRYFFGFVGTAGSGKPGFNFTRKIRRNF